MKAKQIFGILAVLMICSIFSVSQGADRFYYGTYGGWNLDFDFQCMRDSLKFNMASREVDSSNIGYWAQYSLRAIPANWGDFYSPTRWSTQSHYTMWEAEGLLGSNFGFDYTGGRLVLDDSASGSRAWLFEPFRDPAGLIQTGPNYDQEPCYVPGSDSLLYGRAIEYTAEFRLKSPLTYEPRSGGPSPPICILKVVGKNTVGIDTVLAHKVVYKSDFWNFYGYKTFKIEGYTIFNTEDLTDQNPIQFQIYWYGNRKLYIDYVKVYDENGKELIIEKRYDQDIMGYVSQDWVHTIIPETGDTVIYRWALRDEPGSIDLFEPARYIDSLLREKSSERVGFQAFNKWKDETFIHEYFLRQNPQEYHVDIYPTRWWAPDSSGEAFQQGVDSLTEYLRRSRQEAENREKDLWLTIQAFYFGWEILPGDTCAPGCSLYIDTTDIDTAGWYCYDLKRPPTPNELRLQTFLALCYGADAILNYCYNSWKEYHPGLHGNGKYNVTLGLWDYWHNRPTLRWREIKNFTGPRVEALGSVFHQLTWQGACFYDSVGSFALLNGDSSYIDSIVGRDPDSTYVQVGFFEHYGNYFMLVNRRCLETEHETLSVYFPYMPDGPFLVLDMFTNEPVAKICGVNPCIEVTLEPGEGRLFKFEKFIYAEGYYMEVPGDAPPWIYPTIQDAIDAANDWTTIQVNPGTYYENIDFMGKNCTVTSKFHRYPGSPEYINQTIIDGSMPADSDFASVVRFVSGENSCATLKGFTIRNGTGTIYIDRSEPGKYGGGIYCWDSSPTIMNNIINENSVTDDGGGIVCRNASPQILNNLIKENEAGDRGGGIAILPYDQVYTTPIIANNIIVDNVAHDCGGGIFYHASPFIVNNTIVGDSAYDGGGIYVHLHYHGHIENNIIANSLGGNGISGEYGPEVMAYNNVWNNDSLDFDIIYPDSVGNMYWGQNRNGTDCDQYYNISENPGFYDGYHLGEGSACVDAGDNEAPYLLPTDFEGNRRLVGFVDIGAYEYQSGSRGGGGAKIAGGDTTSENKSGAGAPKAFELSQNYPNPFNPVTCIRFAVGKTQSPSHISLKIYNLCGQLVRTLVDEEKIPGTYTVTWDGKNNSGKEVASGIYFYQLKSKNFNETKRMVLIK